MKVHTAAVFAACLALAACADSQNIDKSAEYGPDPKLPEPSRALLPRMHIPDVIGWSRGETPTVPQGFRIEAMATGLSNPRNVYPLPNGDLLVIESKKVVAARATASCCFATPTATAGPRRRASLSTI